MILIGLGSNLGDKVQHLCAACTHLQAAGIVIRRRSPLYQTPPWGIETQDWFLNAVCELLHPGPPEALLDLLLDIETRMGRVRQLRWGPRCIDLDLLEFHRERRYSDRLQLPHPYYPEREFVLAPLAHLAPDWVPTGHSLPVTALLARLPERRAQAVASPACWADAPTGR